MAIKYDKQAAKNIELSYNTPDIARQRLQTLQALSLNAGEHVLDVGCGTAFLAREMAALVGGQGRVVGIDNSDDMLAVGRERCNDLPQIELKQAAADQIPAADNSFDVVTCTQVLLYVPDLDAALSELYRVLKPGGRIAIVETDWRGVVINSSDDVLSRRILSAFDQAVPNPNLPPKLRTLLKQKGFRNLRTEAIPILNTSMTPANFSVTSVRWLSGVAKKYGHATAEEVQQWRDDLAEKAKNNEYFFCVNRFLFSAIK
ncbi:MAG: methyltransferase domain-containing protein [Thiolinea sp.]